MLLLLLLLLLLLPTEEGEEVALLDWADFGSVAKFLRGGGGGGDEVAVVKCKDRRQALRRGMGEDSGGVASLVLLVPVEVTSLLKAAAV